MLNNLYQIVNYKKERNFFIFNRLTYTAYQIIDKNKQKSIMKNYAFRETNFLPLERIGLCITSNCNLNCWHCYNFSGGQKKCMSLRKIKTILKDAYDIGVLSVNFTGGEPFIRADFLDIIAFADSLGLGIDISTNGTKITKTIAKKLAKYCINRIVVSLDDVAEKHDRLRGKKLTYFKVINGIKNLDKNNIPIVIRTTIDFKTAKNLNNIYKELKKLKLTNLKSWTLISLVNFGNAKKLFKNLNYLDYLKKAKNMAKNFKKEKLTMPIKIDSLFLHSIKNPPHYICQEKQNYLYAEPNGQIKGCALHDVSLGNITKESIKKIWLSQKAKRIKFCAMSTTCQNCKFKYNCLAFFRPCICNKLNKNLSYICRK